MRISVFGLGYVGTVSAACLAADGHQVIGVDPADEKVRIINEGRSPVIEERLPDLVAGVVDSGRLRATTDFQEAIAASEVALVCVGTPSKPNGDLDLTYVRNVAAEIGTALADRDDFFVVVFRSTMLPGTTSDVLIPILEEASGKRAGADFGVSYNPEFLREGSSVEDYYSPPKIVVGVADAESADTVAALYADIEAPRIETSPDMAELMKYVDNSWHALKVTFGNEIGRLAKAYGMDGRELMEMFMMDTKLNISSRYLRPGYAFGGSCLPKELRAISSEFSTYSRIPREAPRCRPAHARLDPAEQPQTHRTVLRAGP